MPRLGRPVLPALLAAVLLGSGCTLPRATPRLASDPAELEIRLSGALQAPDATPASGGSWGWEPIDLAVADAARQAGYIVESTTDLGERFRAYELLGHLDEPGELRLDREPGVLRARARLGRFGEDTQAERLLRDLRSALR